VTDQAKCAGVGCPIRDGCDRFVRPAVDGQRWIEPVWRIVWGFAMRCVDMLPIVAEGFHPHGGAREEGDGA